MRSVRWRWGISVGAACGLLLVAALPPRPFPEGPTLLSGFLGASSFGWAVGSRDWVLERAARTLRDRVAAREHGAAAVRLVRQGTGVLRATSEPVSVVFDAGVPPSAARTWLASAERELSAYPRAGAGVPVIITLTKARPESQGSEPDSWWSIAQSQYVEDGVSACIVAHRFSRAQQASGSYGIPERLGGQILGRCALYARYGLPGRQVQRWIGLADGWSGGMSWYWRRSLTGEVWRARLRAMRDTVPWAEGWTGVPYRYIGCLRGATTSCEVVAGLDPWAVRPRGWWYGYYEETSSEAVAGHLIANRPTEAFVRFWRSELPVGRALASAYGVPAGALVQEAMLRRLVPPPVGRASARQLFAAAAWLAVMLGLAWLGAWRKEILS